MNIFTNPTAFEVIFVSAACFGIAVAITVALALTNPKGEDR